MILDMVQAKKIPVCEWKEKNGLKTYFNASNSPDLDIIENCWLPPKNYVHKFPHWNDKETWALIIEGWEQSITGVRTYPQRFRDVIATGGQLTGW